MMTRDLEEQLRCMDVQYNRFIDAIYEESRANGELTNREIIMLENPKEDVFDLDKRPFFDYMRREYCFYFKEK